MSEVGTRLLALGARRGQEEELVCGCQDGNGAITANTEALRKALAFHWDAGRQKQIADR